MNFDSRVLSPVAAFGWGVRRIHRDPAPLRARVVSSQVRALQDLLYPGGVGVDHSTGGSELEHQLDVLTENRPEDRLGAANDGIQVEAAGLDDLAAGER